MSQKTHSSAVMKFNTLATSVKCQLFRKDTAQSSQSSLGRFGLYLLGFRRISSEQKLKDLLCPERMKKSFISPGETGQDCCHMMVFISSFLQDLDRKKQGTRRNVNRETKFKSRV